MGEPYWAEAFDFSKEGEFYRFVDELRGYMAVSLNHGTDTEGRKYALDALFELALGHLILTPNWKPFNQEDESTFPEKSGRYLVKSQGEVTVKDWVEEVFWGVSCVTKYMPIPKG